MTDPTLKLKAVDFLKLVVARKVQEAYRKYISKDFVHHNAYFKSDRQSLMEAMEEDAAENPGKIFKLFNAIQEEDLVAVHSHIKLDPEDPGYALIHIFRFEDGMIAEMWDVGQALPEDPLNDRGMF
jgi:predicted SnoaL-like aldol condensation-catalyzing enzyme